VTDDPLPPEGAGRPDPEAYGRALRAGFGVNLLVTDVARAARWQAAVLGARVIYREAAFAIVTGQGATWFLHHDSSYGRHPLVGLATRAEARGAGAELRLYGLDPDAAEAAADAAGVTLGGGVLAGAADKPHGLREVFLVDPDGYCWVPCRPLG